MNKKSNALLIFSILGTSLILVLYGHHLNVNHIHPFDSLTKKTVAIIWLLMLLRYLIIRRYCVFYFSRSNPTDSLFHESEQSSSWLNHRSILWIGHQPPTNIIGPSLNADNQTDYGRWWTSTGLSVLHINYHQMPAHNTAKIMNQKFKNIFLLVNIDELTELTVQENIKSLLQHAKKQHKITLIIDQCQRLNGWALAKKHLNAALPQCISLSDNYNSKINYMNDIDFRLGSKIAGISRNVFQEWNSLSTEHCSVLHEWPYQLSEIKNQLLRFLERVQNKPCIRKIEWSSRANQLPQYDALSKYIGTFLPQLNQIVLTPDQQQLINIGVNAPTVPLNWQPLFWSVSITALLSTSSILLWKSYHLKNQWQIMNHTHKTNNLALNAAIVASASEHDLYQALSIITKPASQNNHRNVILINALKEGNLMEQAKRRLDALEEQSKIGIIQNTFETDENDIDGNQLIDKICNERIASEQLLGSAPEICILRQPIQNIQSVEQPTENEVVSEPEITELDLTEYLEKRPEIKSIYDQMKRIEENLDSIQNGNEKTISQLSLSLDPELLESFIEENDLEKSTIQRDFLQVLHPLFVSNDEKKAAFTIVKNSKNTSYSLFNNQYDKKWMRQLQKYVLEHLIELTHQHIYERYQNEVLPFYLSHLKNRYPFDPSSSRNINLQKFEDFFKRNGIFNAFIHNTYQAILQENTKDKDYQYREIQGILLSENRDFLKKIMHADIMTNLIFDVHHDKPSFNLTIHVKDPNTPIELALNHNHPIPLHDVHKPYHQFHWPNDFQGSIEWAPNSDNMMAEKGPWGLFRLINELGFQSQDHSMIHTTWQGQRVEITSNHAVNPLNMDFYRGFSLPETLENSASKHLG